MHEARIENTPEGRVPAGDGWFILNLAEMAWVTVAGFGTALDFDDPGTDPSQRVGVHVHVLGPGEANGYYHAEAAQEGFLVLSGECLAVVEGEERPMRQWDYLHSPAGTEHITIGAGHGPCAILMFGSPDPRRKVSWIANDTAAKHGASVARTTSVGTEVYGEIEEVRVPAPEPFARARHLRRALELAAAAREAGDMPFGSLLVGPDGDVLAEATNTVLSEHDISAHPELKLARWAARELDAATAGRTTMYTSCEPCPMCRGAIARSGLGRVVFALSGDQLRDLRPPGTPAPDDAAVSYDGPLLPAEGRAPLSGYYDR